MADKNVLILNNKQVQQRIDRMAYQIWEDNLTEKELVMAGIADCGYVLAQRVTQVLEKISGIRVILMKIELDKDSTHLKAKTDIDIEQCANKVVVLADDVLNSGRTLAYGLGVFLDIPLKKLRTMVMVDRSHRVFPVTTDFTGIALATVLKEHVDVSLGTKTGKDFVSLR
ncbi:phosphoribosyltransferase [Pedobacter sp. BS3]|uniref:phosphoribosyltransferase family protein n=1 Tax=Pedobacter sp. BS3 TaxID=2567937 RepID=UPI0011F01ED8|nr:phosphoribosyltransferase family protein [Pedobacter sp. BS3]TZF82047.1 phosphoribosyltransferase [Pedobacter sp. BS3]